MSMHALSVAAACVALIGAVPARAAEPLACVPAAATDPSPWVHNQQVLDSFPSDVPPPLFLGRFGSSRAHELHLWQDAAGLFGEWLSPVLDADSPTSRLYDVRFDAQS